MTARLLALLVFVLLAAGCGQPHSGPVRLSSADSFACAHPTPVRQAIARLQNFDVWIGTLNDRVATDTLYPRYPTALLPEKDGIAPHHRFKEPVTITAFYCADGSPIRLFEASPGHADPGLPRPARASAVEHAGTPSVSLTWPPPIQSTGDPNRWFVTPLDYKPGTAIWRFSQNGKVVDRLTVRVCTGDATGRCHQG